MTTAESYSQWRPHPWHGLKPGPRAPQTVEAYIEMTPFDTVKFEIDKDSGYLRVDRPQQTSSQPPTLYGFIPGTYCDKEVQRLSPKSNCGDGDPLDICVLSERAITRAEILLSARVIGGLQMVDNGEADDKIIAVLEKDLLWAHVSDIQHLPEIVVERLRHYFMTYKQYAMDKMPPVSIEHVYGAAHAQTVVKAAIADYKACFHH